MIPDIQLQLKSVVKSLKDNVLPAVDPENELAQQQIQLSMATLDMVLNNLPLIHSVLRKDISQHLTMASQLADAVSATDSKARLTEIMAAAEQALQDPAKGFSQLQDVARSLRSGIGEIISANDADADAIEKVVLANSDASLLLGRALNLPTGFEPASDELTEVLAQLSLPS